MSLRERIGIDLSPSIRIEDGVEWAAKNGVRYLDIQLDTAANAITSFDAKRVAAVRGVREKHDIDIGLHTSSAVNVAEYAPHASEGVDNYLKAYVDIYGELGAEWIVVHAGYHFGKDREDRMKAGLERLKRLADCFRNGHEVHLKPGDGDLDFGEMFRLTEGRGFKGHYTNAFGKLDGMLAARDVLVRHARNAGVDVG